MSDDRIEFDSFEELRVAYDATILVAGGEDQIKGDWVFVYDTENRKYILGLSRKPFEAPSYIWLAYAPAKNAVRTALHQIKEHGLK